MFVILQRDIFSMFYFLSLEKLNQGLNVMPVMKCYIEIIARGEKLDKSCGDIISAVSTPQYVLDNDQTSLIT